MSLGRWHIAVLIPARDEEQLLPRCLRSVLEACRRLPRRVTSDIVIVVDRSTDNTREVAEDLMQQEGVVIETNVGCVGSSRALAAEIALGRYRGPRERCWLANTDADCEVPEDWLTQQLCLAESGYAAVAGIIDVDSFVEHEASVPQLFRLTYLINTDGTHPHVHGANLGVRADAYVQSGGWRNLMTAEDHDLWQRLHHGKHRRSSNASLRVVTSGRRIGRAPHGFADALAVHNGATG
jgi:cellulose synthase/poly-beta-1,6-N-acetylglucosamine synthase-like glycosyltransferase